VLIDDLDALSISEPVSGDAHGSHSFEDSRAGGLVLWCAGRENDQLAGSCARATPSVTAASTTRAIGALESFALIPQGLRPNC